MSTRLRDWQSRLSDLVAQRRRAPFAWGERDCCLWAADVVLAVTGTDHAADLRGTYADAAGADAVLQARGGVEAVCAAALGPQMSPASAQPGDIGLVIDPERGAALVACVGGGRWLAQVSCGLAPMPVQRVLAAWRCCRG